MSDSPTIAQTSAPGTTPQPAVPATATTTRPSIWQTRDFLLLFGGQTVSQFGGAVTTFAIPWLLLQTTGSGTATGVAFAVGFVPYLLIVVPAGVWADRWNRRTLMLIADAGRMLLILSIPLVHGSSGRVPVWLMFAVQGGTSGLSALFDASYGACLPSLVGKSQLAEANAALKSAFSLSRLLGPIIAGALVTMMRTANLLVADGLSFFASIVTLLSIRSALSVQATHLRSPSRPRMLADVQVGVRYVWSVWRLRMLALFSALVNLVGPGMDVALIYRVQHELRLPSQWAGLIMAALSGGMVIGSFLIRRLGRRYSMGRLIVFAAAAQVAPAFVLAFCRVPWLMVLVQIAVGMLLVVWNVQTVTLRQSIVPNALLGRCVSVFRFIAWVTIPIGDAAAGIISQRFGTEAFFLAGAITLSAVCLLCIGTRFYRISGGLLAPPAQK